MKKKLIALLSFGLLAAASQLFSQVDNPGKFYVAVRGGAYWLDSITINGAKVAPDAGYSISGAVGYEMFLTDFGNYEHPLNLRLEVESGYANVSKSVTVSGQNVSGNIDSVPVMFNVLIDYYFTSSFYAYGGIGAGLCITDFSVDYLGSQNTTNYAVQARAGLGYKINEVVALEVGYRIFSEKFKEPVGQTLEGGIVLRF